MTEYPHCKCALGSPLVCAYYVPKHFPHNCPSDSPDGCRNLYYTSRPITEPEISLEQNERDFATLCGRNNQEETNND